MGGHLSIEELEAAFEHELRTNKRAAAETAYALAFRYRGEDIDGRRRFDLAGQWAGRAVRLLDSLPSDTTDQVSTSRASVGGIPLPDLLHASVVRVRLADVFAWSLLEPAADPLGE